MIRPVTYAMITDNRGIRHWVGEDDRSLCGYIFGGRFDSSIMGYRVGGTTYSYPDECPKCLVNLYRSHGSVPDTDEEPF